MCYEEWTEDVELLALFIAEQLRVCSHCNSENLKHGVVLGSCPPRPYVFCADCKKTLA